MALSAKFKQTLRKPLHRFRKERSLKRQWNHSSWATHVWYRLWMLVLPVGFVDFWATVIVFIVGRPRRDGGI